MKINPMDRITPPNLERPAAPARRAPESPGPETGGDRVNVSGRAAEINRFSTIAAGLPDVRTELVQKLTEMIQTGQYKSPPDELSQAVLRGSLLNLEV